MYLAALGQRSDDDYVTRVASDPTLGLIWTDTGERLAQAEIDRYWSIIRARNLPAAPYITGRMWSTSLLPGGFLPGEPALPTGVPAEAAWAPTTEPGIPTWIWWAAAALVVGGVGFAVLSR